MCTQVIHYPMYLYAYCVMYDIYCVMYDIYCITHSILLIVSLSKFAVNGNNCLLSIY